MLGMLMEFSVMDVLYSILGIAIVFAVLAILIGYLFIQRKVLGLFEGKNKKAAENKAVDAEEVPLIEDDGISEEEIAAVTAALMAFYESDGEDSNAEFVVRKIRRIH